MKVGRYAIVIFSKDVFGKQPLPVAFEIDYFSLPIKESKGTLKIFQEVNKSMDYISSIMHEISEKSLSLLKK